jgi:hypothetical protein
LRSSQPAKKDVCLSGYHCSEVIPPLYSIRIGEGGRRRRWTALTACRNPFNDSLIASGSDDGKVRAHIHLNGHSANISRCSCGECQMISLCT